MRLWHGRTWWLRRSLSGFVEHAYIEPEAGFTQVVDGRVEIHACTQAPVMDLDSMAEILAMPREAIRIVPTAVGGEVWLETGYFGAAVCGFGSA